VAAAAFRVSQPADRVLLNTFSKEVPTATSYQPPPSVTMAAGV
jgi:hypothetical protein